MSSLPLLASRQHSMGSGAGRGGRAGVEPPVLAGASSMHSSGSSRRGLYLAAVVQGLLALVALVTLGLAASVLVELRALKEYHVHADATLGGLSVKHGDELRQLKAELDKLEQRQHGLHRLSEAVQQTLTALTHEPRGLYLGDGKVLCFAEPLQTSMVLEAEDKGMTVHLCRGRGWEPEISSVFRRLVKPGQRVLDVGTNVGYYTIMFAQLVGAEGRVLGIEASPRTYDLLSTTLEFNGLLSSHVQLLHRAALNVDNRTVQFTTATGRALNNRVKSSIPSGFEEVDTSPTVAVQSVTLSTAVADWPALDFVKIDVEGAEALAYEGLRAALRRFPNATVVMEVNTRRMGVDTARALYRQVQADFPELRRIVRDAVVPTSVPELLGNMQTDDLLVLSLRQGQLLAPAS